MENIEIIVDKEENEHVIIENTDGSFTSMPKAIWDEQQKAAELGGTL